MYCGKACAQSARQDKLRASNRRYQLTAQGRRLHARRQSNYRLRALRGRSVTEQGQETTPVDRDHAKRATREAWCRAPQTPFLRFEPLSWRRSMNRTGPPSF
jgi:hypothetical protein